MSPKKAWGTPKRAVHGQAPFPSLVQVDDSTMPKSHYEEIQEDELIALSSIYGEDYQALDAQGGAWKKTEPAFQIIIKSSDERLKITLRVTFVATYPRSPPILALAGSTDLRDVTSYRLRKVIDSKPKELAKEEQPMIMEIVDALRDILEEAAIAKAAGLELPSLEEERARHEADLAKASKEHEAAEDRRRQRETEEEDRVLQDMVQDELKRQKAKADEAKRKTQPRQNIRDLTLEDSPESHTDRFLFDQPITFTDDDGNPRIFQAVIDQTSIRRGPVSECFSVRPLLKGQKSQRLALKKTNLSTLDNESDFKGILRVLESDLEKLKTSRHRNVLELLDYKIEKDPTENGQPHILWTSSVLMEFANKGSLEELLDIAGGIDVEKVRAWTIELLDALRYLHDRGIVHQDLHAGNVMLVRSTSGDVTAKIADAGYQRQLHDLKGIKTASSLTYAKSTYWCPPENANLSKPHYTQKTDVWDFGVVFLQMIFGLSVFQKYAAPERLMDALPLSNSLNEILRKFFKPDPKRRPRAFELSSSEWLATDAPVLVDDSSANGLRVGSFLSPVSSTPGRQRRESFVAGSAPLSRWKLDFSEVSRLGKGGFGEVLKARKKLDGQFYAIKTITQKPSASLTEILKEVRLLSQLNHPYVVRYYNTWTEEITDGSETDDDATESSFALSDAFSDASTGPNNDPDMSTGGLDFMSSSGYPQVEFGYGSEDEGSTEQESDGDSDAEFDIEGGSTSKNQHGSRSLVLKRTRSDSLFHKSTRTILYIQMEYCERRTLRDLIKRDLYKDDDEAWRLFRQILEGMAHIHSLNVVHRDLKPENVFIDGALNVRIGDFGLATSGQFAAVDKSNSGLQSTHNMTTSIGTASYVAPEVKSAIGTYNSKVDMYSLGIIFFEMNYAPATGMERAHVLHGLRQANPRLPADFEINIKGTQADIVLSLVDHNPKSRPTSTGLLQSGKLPVQMESETIRQTLAGLADPTSPYYAKMMAALFSRSISQAQDFAWDMEGAAVLTADHMLRSVVRQQLVDIFRRHGALETSRQSIFPRSGHYGPSAVQLLDSSGNLLQLPYDLTLPNARSVAKTTSSSLARTFTFGHVFRDKAGSQPICFGEVDFDIASDGLDLALKDAEVIKILDEIILDFPSLNGRYMCFYLNHSDLLNVIFDFCRIDANTRTAVAECLSKLNIQQWTWQKIRNELRSPALGVSATSLDDLQRFDFRDIPGKTFQKLKAIFEGTEYFEKASPAIAHLNEIIQYAKRLDVHSKIVVSPLNSLKEKFYKGGFLFSCVYDSKHRDVFAAGGRYDSLVREYRPRVGGKSEDRHAVGFSLAWEKLASSMSRHIGSTGKSFMKKTDEENNGPWSSRRCDVLVASFDPELLRTVGVDILQSLWANDISAELASDARSAEDLLAKHTEDHYCWTVIIKQDSVLRIKTMTKKNLEDTDLPITQLIPWLRGEIRDRELKEGNHERAKLLRHPSQHDTNSSTNQEQEVHVLVSQTKSKKSNRRNIVEQAHVRAASLVKSFLDGPIAAIETTDHVLELIRGTKLSDPDSWRQVSHNVPMAERRYVGEIHDLMKNLATQTKEVTRNAFVYNFRTGSCIYYDLGS